MPGCWWSVSSDSRPRRSSVAAGDAARPPEARARLGGRWVWASDTEQAAIYGGIVGEQYDPCYHEVCDTFKGTGAGLRATPPGLGLVSLDQLSDGVAHATLAFAMTTSAVPCTDKGSDKAAQTAEAPEFWGPKRIK